MMGGVVSRSGLAAVVLLGAVAAEGHHSRTIYDTQRSITIDGVVTVFEWANPHVYLYVETQTDSGDSVVWAIEQSSTTGMRRRGWSPDTLAAGDRVRVEAHPARTAGSNMALVAVVHKQDVNLYGGGSFEQAVARQERSAVPADGLTGTWIVEPLPLYQQFSRPQAWPLTGKGRAALTGYDDATMNPQLDCKARTAPWFMLFPSVQRIDVGDAVVSIRSEYDAIERTVHMGLDTHAGAMPLYQGHSIGWWEGEVLVVDTTHFADHRSGNARGVPSGPQKHLIERFELSPDRTSFTYRFELADPEYLAQTITGEGRSVHRPDLQFAPVACDLDNARRFVGERTGQPDR